MEIWKDIKDYEGCYQISNLGNIKSLIRKNNKKEKLLKVQISTCGYYKILLYKNNKSKHFKVHRLIAIHFIPNIYNKEQINHIDGNKLNNNINNLEWVTPKENMQHAVRTGLKDKGIISSTKLKSIPITLYKDGIEFTFSSRNEAARSLGLNKGNLSLFCKGVLKYMKGYTLSK